MQLSELINKLVELQKTHGGEIPVRAVTSMDEFRVESVNFAMKGHWSSQMNPTGTVDDVNDRVVIELHPRS